MWPNWTRKSIVTRDSDPTVVVSWKNTVTLVGATHTITITEFHLVRNVSFCDIIST
jgi:hypothetical protein